MLRRIPNKRYAVPPAFFTPQRCQIIACLFFGCMIMLGAIPGEATALSDAVGDKLLHLGAYSFLTCVLFVGMRGTVASRAFRTVMMIALLGGLDEAVQSFMPYRSASMNDWTFDMLAAGLTLTMLILLGNTGRRMYQAPRRRTIRPAERPN
jgi:hypothetical protein